MLSAAKHLCVIELDLSLRGGTTSSLFDSLTGVLEEVLSMLISKCPMVLWYT